ncbi:tetratricopeptide repeat protein [Candidatus Tisiphia endosymbiont of Mystacides longicornis]|uniref:tetratricopeptide repeat protein n=1 Tax=Candidatus Tisiphia endosymbiont of Mystacides longicornis TaxID=3139330 RepID=UPI003CCAE7ED
MQQSHYLKAKILNSMADYNQSLEAVEQALIYRNSYESCYLKAVIAARTGKINALDAIDKALSINKTYEAYYLKAIILKHQGRYSDAIKSIDNALSCLKNKNANYDISFTKAQLLVSEELYTDEALEIINRVIKISPTYEAYHLQSIILEKQNKYLEALQAVENAISIERTNEIYYRKAQILYNMSQSEETQSEERHLEEALNSTETANAIQESYDAYLLAGTIHELKGNYMKAEISFKQSIKIQKTDDAYKALINLLTEQGKHRDVILVSDEQINSQETFNPEIYYNETTLSINPSIVVTPKYTQHYNDSVELLRSKEYRQSLQKINEALKENETDDAYFIQGVIFRKLWQYDDAIKAFNNALTYAKAHNHLDKLYSIYVSLAFTYKEHLEYQKGLESVNNALNIQKTGYYANCLKGIILWLNEELENALNYVSECLNLKPSPEIAYIEGMIFFERNKWTNALKSFEDCISLGGYKFAEKMLSDVKSNLNKLDSFNPYPGDNDVKSHYGVEPLGLDYHP